MSSNFDGSPLLRDDESMLLYDDGSDARAHRLGSLVSGDALSESDGSSSFDWNWETDPEFSKIGFESNFVASKEFGFTDAMSTPWGIGGVETIAHFASSGFGSMVGGALATGAGLSVEALDVVNRAFGWDEYNVSADRLVETIDFFRDTFAYEPRTEIGKLMTYGFEAYNSISSQPFNNLKAGLGDFGYEWGGSFGPLLGAGLYALPDAALLYAGARLSPPSTTTRGLVDDSFAASWEFKPASYVDGEFGISPKDYGLPNVAANDYLQTVRAQTPVDYYCTAVACDMLDATGGQGKIVVFAGGDMINRWPEKYDWGMDSKFTVPVEAGSEIFGHHSIYTDGKYFYDPLLSNKPVAQSDYLSQMKALNPDGISWRIYDPETNVLKKGGL